MWVHEGLREEHGHMSGWVWETVSEAVGDQVSSTSIPKQGPKWLSVCGGESIQAHFIK